MKRKWETEMKMGMKSSVTALLDEEMANYFPGELWLKQRIQFNQLETQGIENEYREDIIWYNSIFFSITKRRRARLF